MILFLKIMGLLMLALPVLALIYFLDREYPEETDLLILVLAVTLYIIMILIAMWFSLAWWLITL